MTEQSETRTTITMTAVVKDRPERGFSIVEKTIDTNLGPHQVLIKVAMASFCGTDLHIWRYDEWSRKRLKLPLTVGHEFSGRIVKTGSDVTRVKVGDLVSAETHIVCGTCEFCLRGEGHICANTKIIGVDTDGCFASYLKIPEENCYLNSAHVDPLYLSVQEPLGNAVHTITHFPLEGRDVAIVGCGPIGLMAIDVARAYGARRIVALEVNDYRRAKAKELGADLVVDPTATDPIAAVRGFTEGKGVDVVGEFSGSKPAIEAAFKYVKAGGGIAMLGLPNQSIEIDVSGDVVYKGLSIYGVTGRRIPDTWIQVKDLLDHDRLHLDKVVTHVMPLKEVNAAAELMASGRSGKIVLIPEDHA
jgi:threonine 3-dehydrogenase